MSASSQASQVLNANQIEARNVVIQSITNNNDINGTSRREAMQILGRNIAFGALHNSNERFDPPKCHPRTRTAHLNCIKEWAANTSADAKPILWLTGPAGAGKSAIAQTLVEDWKQNSITTLAFFFWRTSSERNQKTRLVPTLAFELLELFPSTKLGIESAVEGGGLFERNLVFQLEHLVMKPLRSIVTSGKQHPVVIVIDGLDECCMDLPKSEDFPGQTYESQQEEILDALSSACGMMPQLRLLIVSRPERQIRKSFATELLERLTSHIFLKDSKDASADIRLFLSCKFQEIRKQHEIDPSWPTEAQLSELIRKSSGQFIYPSVAVKHIMRARVNPKHSLDTVLGLRPGSADNPLSELDMLYTLVLRSVVATSLPAVGDILGYLLHNTRTPAYWRQVSQIFGSKPHETSLSMFDHFLFLSDGETKSHLTDLHSVLDIPPQNSQGAITFIHATFSEYLEDEHRSGDFFIDRKLVLVRCSQLLFRHLHEWSLCSEDQSYDARKLVQRTCDWILECPPSKAVMIHLWSLLQTKLGHGLIIDQGNFDPVPVANIQLSTQFVSSITRVDNLENAFIRGLLKYLQKCNTPEIEPSWLLRALAQYRLAATLSRYSQTTITSPITGNERQTAYLLLLTSILVYLLVSPPTSQVASL